MDFTPDRSDSTEYENTSYNNTNRLSDNDHGLSANTTRSQSYDNDESMSDSEQTNTRDQTQLSGNDDEYDEANKSNRDLEVYGAESSKANLDFTDDKTDSLPDTREDDTSSTPTKSGSTERVVSWVKDRFGSGTGGKQNDEASSHSSGSEMFSSQQLDSDREVLIPKSSYDGGDYNKYEDSGSSDSYGKVEKEDQYGDGSSSLDSGY
jgi:hypothetical protein